MSHSQRPSARRQAFTLVELLVVVGIITLLVGLSLPSLVKAREAAAATKCLSNLRQIGTAYYIYAQSNHDLVPLGVSLIGDTPKLDTTPGPEAPPADYPLAMNYFLYVHGYPSCAGGPFVATNIISGKSGRIFYCPSEIHGKQFLFDTPQNPWPEHVKDATTRISYAVRPVRALWTYDLDGPGYSCTTMQKLVKQKSFALMAELPQVPPFNHGTQAAPYINALYGDGSAHLVRVNAFRHELDTYLATGAAEPGYTKPSADACFQPEDPYAKTIWWVIDHY